MGADLSLSVLAAAREVPNRPALVLADEDGRILCYADLAALVRGRLGDGAGPSVLPLAATGDLETVVRILAAVEARVPVALLHPRWSHAEGARVRAQLAAHDAAADPLQGCLAIVYTSGTSQAPRGVVLGRDAMLQAARASEANLGWRDDDRWLCCLPLAHVGGLSVLLRCLIARRTAVLASGFSARDMPVWIERDGVTLASLVPAMLARLLEDNPCWRPPPRLRAALLGGDGARPSLLAAVAARGIPVLATYGLTEACGQVATQRPGTAPGPEQGCGPPLPGVEVRLDDGRIQVRGPMLLTAYYPRAAHADPRAPDGWLETGDLGRIDEQGRLHVLGRWDDRIVTGGETVFPRDVEMALEEHPAVAEACVFGLPDERWGQVVGALLVARGAPPAEPELRAFLAQRLAPFCRPRRIELVAELPRGRSGKLDRREAARRYGRGSIPSSER